MGYISKKVAAYGQFVLVLFRKRFTFMFFVFKSCYFFTIIQGKFYKCIEQVSTTNLIRIDFFSLYF